MTDGLWSAVGGIGSSLINAVSSSRAMKKAYKYALALQDHQNAFTERMSSTAHQREVVDLRASGLNPIISAMGGSGASTPAAGSATMTPVDERLGEGIMTALDIRRLKNESKLTNAQAGLASAQDAKTKSENAYQKIANAIFEKYGDKTASQQYSNAVAEGKLIDERRKALNITTAQDVRESNSRINLNNSNLALNGYSSADLRRRAEWIRKHPAQAAFTFGLGQYTGAIGNIFGGSFGLSSSHSTIHK